MTRLRTRHVLNTGAALVALASVTACASPPPGTAAAISSIGTVTGLVGKALCADKKTLGCMTARVLERGAIHGLLTSVGPARLPKSDYGKTRRSGGALSPGVFLEHLGSCARQYPVIRQAPPERVLAVALHESGLRPFAIHDNTTRLSHHPETLGQAIALTSSLRQAGHRIDAGVMQVSHANWSAYSLTTESVFDARANICAGARILGESYLIERRAACRYNTGRPGCTNGYPESIDRAVDKMRRVAPLGADARPSTPAN